MMRFLLILFTIVSNILFSQNINLEYLKSFNSDVISSASGVEFVNGKTYIISDDQAKIFSFNDLKQITSYKLIDFEGDRIEKLYKPDFEALSKINISGVDLLLIVSSGSKLDYRDTMYLFNPENNEVIAKRNFRSIYDKMKQVSKIESWVITNIEAVSTNKKYVYLFQRGNINGDNIIYRFNKKEFFNYIVGKRNSLDFEFNKFNLPVYNGTKAGFSGASALDEDEIIFTASLETSATAYADGDVLGSYIGVLNYETGMLYYSIFKNKNKTVVTKLESVYIIRKNTNNEYILYLSSDNDNGISEFYHVKLTR